MVDWGVLGWFNETNSWGFVETVDIDLLEARFFLERVSVREPEALVPFFLSLTVATSSTPMSVI